MHIDTYCPQNHKETYMAVCLYDRLYGFYSLKSKLGISLISSYSENLFFNSQEILFQMRICIFMNIFHAQFYYTRVLNRELEIGLWS